MHTMPKMGHTIPDIRQGAESVKRTIAEHEITGAILVAHSKGGLIGKYVLAHHNDDRRVKGLIAIATPFSGSRMAKIVPHTAFKELLPQSEILRELEVYADVNERIVSVIPEYDNHVWAENGSYLEGATNKKVHCYGHHKVLFSRKVQDVVLESLREMEGKKF